MKIVIEIIIKIDIVIETNKKLNKFLSQVEVSFYHDVYKAKRT